MFAKLQKVPISFVMSVCLSVCLHGTAALQLDSFHEFCYLMFFQKSPQKIQV